MSDNAADELSRIAKDRLVALGIDGDLIANLIEIVRLSVESGREQERERLEAIERAGTQMLERAMVAERERDEARRQPQIAVDAERERCAKIAQHFDYANKWSDDSDASAVGYYAAGKTCDDIASLIRGNSDV